MCNIIILVESMLARQLAAFASGQDTAFNQEVLPVHVPKKKESPLVAGAKPDARRSRKRDLDEDDQAADRAPAVTRAVQILRHLSRRSEPIGVNPLATTLGIVPSTCLHILRALAREGLVSFDGETKRYRLGIGVLGLARAYMASSALPVVVQPLLDGIANRKGVTAALIDRIDEHELIVSAVAQGSDMFSVKVTVGTIFPAFTSASGRCVAAYSRLSRAELRHKFDGVRWQQAPDFKDWLADVEQVDKQGYAIDSGSNVRGLTVIAVPVLDTNGMLLRCVAIVALKDQLSPPLLQALIKEADAVAKKLQSAEF
jgi:DNA-binding IclR family transcriptional regulator